MADRFYFDGPLILGECTLDGAEAHHLAHVRRFAPGDRVTLFNGDGRECHADVIATGKKQVRLCVVQTVQANREIGQTLHIASAMPKGDRADFLIEKLTELGVTDFTPLLTTRSIVVPKASIVDKLKRMVIEASKQCGRNVLMQIHPPLRLEQWLAGSLPPSKWIMHPGGRELHAVTIAAGGLAVAIGPEGGFTEEELATAEQCGFEVVSFGPRVLRIETAALAIAAATINSLSFADFRELP